MKKTTLIIFTIAFCLCLNGCGNSSDNDELNEKYTNIKQENEQLKEANDNLEKQVAELESKYNDLQDQYDALVAEYTEPMPEKNQEENTNGDTNDNAKTSDLMWEFIDQGNDNIIYKFLDACNEKDESGKYACFLPFMINYDYGITHHHVYEISWDTALAHFVDDTKTFTSCSIGEMDILDSDYMQEKLLPYAEKKVNVEGVLKVTCDLTYEYASGKGGEFTVDFTIVKVDSVWYIEGIDKTY